DAERLAGVDGEVDAVDRLDRPDLLLEDEAAHDREVLLEPLDPQQFRAACAHAASWLTSAAFFWVQMRARASSSRWQRNLCSSPTDDSSSAGSSCRQTFITNSQRGWNGQPLGGFSSDGGWPGIWSSRAP